MTTDRLKGGPSMFTVLSRLEHPRLVGLVLSAGTFLALYLPDLASAGHRGP